MKQTLHNKAFLDRLSHLFHQEGFRHFTIGELAARLHCSRRRLYAVAESKEASRAECDRLSKCPGHQGETSMLTLMAPIRLLAA